MSRFPVECEKFHGNGGSFAAHAEEAVAWVRLSHPVSEREIILKGKCSTSNQDKNLQLNSSRNGATSINKHYRFTDKITMNRNTCCQ